MINSLIKFVIPVLIIFVTYQAGYSSGANNTTNEYNKKLKELQTKNAKDLAILQQELLDTETQLLNDTDKIKIKYKTKVKEIVKYVHDNKTTTGVPLSKCILPPDGLHKILSAYDNQTSSSK